MLKAVVAAGLACTFVALAQGAVLSLPCTGSDARPVPDTVVMALREEGGAEPMRVPARDGVCRIELPAGAHWVKAEAPGLRSVAIRVADGAAPGRALRLQPMTGRDADAIAVPT